MSGNIMGKFLRLTTFGESHGKMIGGIIDGLPAGIYINNSLIKNDLLRRKPGQSSITSERKEEDSLEIISGVSDEITNGTPLAFIIYNKDVRKKDYEKLKDVFRPSHADYTYYIKYGQKSNSGGGRSSARETASWVAAGAIAKCFLKRINVEINAYTSGIGSIDIKENYKDLDLRLTEKNIIRCPDLKMADKMEKAVHEAKQQGDTIGGRISCVISGIPPGVGEPVFDKLHASLGKAMLSIPAAKGFEYGSGFSGSYMKGSEHNDEFFITDNGNVSTITNYSGGIQGGISNGNDIYFRVAFKPVSSISKKQKSVSVDNKETELEIKGRHDPCVVPRAVPIVEAMAAFTVADQLIASQVQKIVSKK